MKGRRSARDQITRLGILVAGFGMTLLPQVAGAQVPPPAPLILDPMPGPFIVRFDSDGRLVADAEGILANAAASWMLGGLDSYLICGQPGSDERIRRNSFGALQSVAARLKALGARTVVTISGGVCPAGMESAYGNEPYIYVLGTVNLTKP